MLPVRNCKRCAFCSSILCFTLASFSCTVVRRCSCASSTATTTTIKSNCPTRSTQNKNEKKY
ncbi:hypothetical protein PF005_g15347 [Phytophthora fragariae]|uniref:Secreted protein n=1 Tax=Phytophthora fragariae TaxID=53985 RepID=A0A6A3XFH0_9STRA|nr:hypothetical protein PF003_g18828 [Phytophthora fragariae]KAE8921080.1 hypothetical protein PF009_g28633 [Phytophthora fragariae]KAE9067539.1 hypothetical protein PF007_g28029 [Phytophthora fragariae]KAE9088039.1 hypothetical protein PF006_g25671 [Phytophthora fragariae]KAE9200433.1 hypothetical protein PF005_g15347 [Phytophthora fragariae]